jgi:hypothetical protein
MSSQWIPGIPICGSINFEAGRLQEIEGPGFQKSENVQKQRYQNSNFFKKISKN